VYAEVIQETLAGTHARWLTDWYLVEAFPPESAMIMDIRKADDTAAAPTESAPSCRDFLWRL
jgi:hypothetical protein